MARGQLQKARPNGNPASQTRSAHGALKKKSSRNSTEVISPLSQSGVKKTLTPQRKTRRTLLPNNDQPLRRSPRFAALKKALEQPTRAPATAPDKPCNPVEYWVTKGKWPATESTPIEMAHLLAQVFPSSQTRKSSRSPALSDEKSRTQKRLPYQSSHYEKKLEDQGSFMCKPKVCVAEDSKRLVQDLSDGIQPVPKESIFDDDIFEDTCENLRNSNEFRIIQDISRLIVPSAESHALRAKELRYLCESVNAGWSASIPLFGARPQPDYAVGFKRQAFTMAQLKKLRPFLGDAEVGSTSFFMGTYDQYFPFLACESKGFGGVLEIADRQNAHSMTLAVRGIAELFRFVNLENEVDRQILAFSISHDHSNVKIYGHYPDMSEERIQYYRYRIRSFDFTEPPKENKWMAYRFIKNVYDNWVPNHYKRLCAAINQVPDKLDFVVDSSENADDSTEPPKEHHSSLGMKSTPSTGQNEGVDDG